MRILPILLVVLVALLAYRVALIEPKISAVPFTFTTDGLPTMKPNQRLVGQAVERLFPGEVKAPEHFAFRGDEIYFGTHDGRISRTVQSADGSLSPLETIVYVGDRHSEANATFPCGTEQSEDKCGRPLGMTFATAGELKGKLIVADCTRGLLAVDVDTRAKTLLTEQVDGLPVFFTNSVVVGPRTGKIYFTDSSQRWRRTDFIFECMESRPTGRLIEYDPKTKQARTLVDDVAFANGLLVDPDETYILFVELNRAQILRVDLAAVAKRPGKTPIHWNARREVDDEAMSVFIQNLPGIPDNLMWEADGAGQTFWVGCGTKRSAPFNVLDAAGPYPRVRNFLINYVVPKHLILSLVERIGLLVRIRVQSKKTAFNPHGWAMGTILETLQDPTGALHLLTGAYEHAGFLYLGSISNHVDFLPRIKWNQANKTDDKWRQWD